MYYSAFVNILGHPSFLVICVIYIFIVIDVASVIKNLLLSVVTLLQMLLL